MFVKFKKKSKSYFFIVSIVSFCFINNVVSVEHFNNDTVIMKIKYKNFSDHVKPRAILSQHVSERRGTISKI